MKKLLLLIAIPMSVSAADFTITINGSSSGGSGGSSVSSKVFSQSEINVSGACQDWQPRTDIIPAELTLPNAPIAILRAKAYDLDSAGNLSIQDLMIESIASDQLIVDLASTSGLSVTRSATIVPGSGNVVKFYPSCKSATEMKIPKFLYVEFLK